MMCNQCRALILDYTDTSQLHLWLFNLIPLLYVHSISYKSFTEIITVLTTIELMKYKLYKFYAIFLHIYDYC